MQNVLIVGAGIGGTAILQLLLETKTMNIIAMVDKNQNAAGIALAKQVNVQTGQRWEEFINHSIDVVIDATGDRETLEAIQKKVKKRTIIIPGSVAFIISRLMEEKKDLYTLQETILNSTTDGMIAIDKDKRIIMVNASAENMIGFSKEKVIGKNVKTVINGEELTRILQTKEMEKNKKFVLSDGRVVITTRIPLVNNQKEIVGALSVFKDSSEVEKLAEENTNLKEIRIMLEAIIHSSEEAISVVDEKGQGIMINPAYTKLTGLGVEEVVGKPASIDISEGESIHMQVLHTKKPVKGARLKIGPSKKDVVVNVAPVIVDGKLKGSVGVIRDVSEVKALTKELELARQLIRTLEAKYSFDDIIGKSEEMTFAKEQAKLGAKTPATVLLRGESGTGKELFAHAIHNESERKRRPFIRVNCAAIPETLLESELFGYEDGAFSGAKRGGKKGLFEEANHGTIFLDEIGEISLPMQAKLLRVLQEKEIVRVGGSLPIPINVRIIAATNVKLEQHISQHKIREDLFYRINRLPIHIPPLRRRLEDISELCAHVIQKLNQDYGKHVEGISSEAVDILKSKEWPGNVRELENTLGRAMINMKIHEKELDVHHLHFFMNERWKGNKEGKGESVTGSLPGMLASYEKNIIQTMLEQFMGNKTKVAKELGISVRNLYYKLEKYNLD